jgi:type II secretory pathway pseudopilin PulG
MLTQLQAAATWLSRAWQRAKAHPRFAAMLYLVAGVWAVHSFFRDEAPWVVVVWWWRLLAGLTLAQAVTLAIFVVALLAASALVSGYYERRVEALEAQGASRDLRLRLSSVESANESVSAERDLFRTERDQFKKQVTDFPRQLHVLQRELADANRRAATFQLRYVVLDARLRGVPNPSVTLRFIETSDTDLVDMMSGTFREIAPEWPPVAKKRDDGSTIRQGPHAHRIVFASTNEDLARVMAHCFQVGGLANGEPTIFTSDAPDANLLVTVYPKR